VEREIRRLPVDFWFDSWGDRVQLTSDETTSCLGKLATLIREYDPDILMTEEIEVDSKRSAYADMVRYFLENTDLGYGAYFETWNASYVPSEGLGRINLGNAIFSRSPIIRAERIRQVDRTDQDLLTKTFTRRHGRDPVTHSQRGSSSEGISAGRGTLGDRSPLRSPLASLCAAQGALGSHSLQQPGAPHRRVGHRPRGTRGPRARPRLAS